MFKPEDYEIPLEMQLKLRVINDEINNCNDIDELRNQLIAVTKIFTQYKQLLEIAVKGLIEKDLEAFGLLDKIEVSKK